jgi:hypothetical protein
MNRQRSEERDEMLSEKVPPTITIDPPQRIDHWVQPTHERHLVTQFPTMGSDWTKLSDSGNLQRFLSGQDSTITLTIHGGPNRPDSKVMVRRTVPVPPRSIIFVEDAKLNGNSWWFVSIPVEPEADADDDGENPI